MLVLTVEPAKAPEVKDIPNNLREMQALVGGRIQAIYPFPEENVALICNEEGWLLGLPGNRALRDSHGMVRSIIWGTFFLCGAPVDSENFVSLTPEQVSRFERMFHTPEAVVRSNGRIICVPVETEIRT